MRIGSLGLVALLVAGAVACKSDKSSDKASGPRKLRKMDFHTTIDDRGRMKIAFRLFDAKHETMPVTGSYTAEVTKLDGSLLCKAAGELAPADFSEKGTHQAPWHDAACPADPGADEVKVNVKVTVPAATAGKGKDEKDDKGDKGDAKGGDGKDAAKDTVFDRSITIPVRSIYDRPPPKKPAAGSATAGSAAAGSAAAGGAAAGSAAAGSAAAGTAAAGSAAAGTAAAGTAAAGTAEKPTAEKPTAEKPTEAKPAAGSAR